MSGLYLFSVYLHILAAMIWLGGMLFLGLVVVPAIRRPGFRGQSAPLLMALGLRFRPLGWICLALFLVTGTFNLLHRLPEATLLYRSAFWTSPFGEKLLAKLLIFAVILVISTVHDFRVGPRAARLLSEGDGAAEAEQYRRLASWLGRLTLILGLGAAYLGVIVVRSP